MAELTRLCVKCKEERDIEQFAKYQRGLYRRRTCQVCRNQRTRERYNDPSTGLKERENVRVKLWSQKNPEKIKQRAHQTVINAWHVRKNLINCPQII